VSEDVPAYGATVRKSDTVLSVDEIRPDDSGQRWFVKFRASSSGTPLDDDWWTAFITVLVARIAGESIESLTTRAEAAMRKVLHGLSKT
jgi:hypothetical protein